MDSFSSIHEGNVNSACMDRDVIESEGIDLPLFSVMTMVFWDSMLPLLSLIHI